MEAEISSHIKSIIINEKVMVVDTNQHLSTQLISEIYRSNHTSGLYTFVLCSTENQLANILTMVKDIQTTNPHTGMIITIPDVYSLDSAGLFPLTFDPKKWVILIEEPGCSKPGPCRDRLIDECVKTKVPIVAFRYKKNMKECWKIWTGEEAIPKLNDTKTPAYIPLKDQYLLPIPLKDQYLLPKFDISKCKSNILKIVFTGNAGSGKSLSVLNMHSLQKGYQMSFAGPIYDIMRFAQKTCGLPFEKDRQFLQIVGTEWGRTKNVDMWTNILIEKVKKMISTTKKDERFAIYIDDLRFLSEAKKLRDEFKGDESFYFVRIIRPTCDKSDQVCMPDEICKLHSSETEQRHIVVDEEVINDGDLKSLQQKLIEVMNRAQMKKQ